MKGYTPIGRMRRWKPSDGGTRSEDVDQRIKMAQVGYACDDPGASAEGNKPYRKALEKLKGRALLPVLSAG
jgi:hypothetical protein